MNTRSRPVAILMGDLVGSEAKRADRLNESFNAAVGRINESESEFLKSPLTITLGDEFHGLASSLSQGSAIMRKLRLAMMDEGMDCRFVLGLANIETPINADRAWNMMGPGLARARAKLDEKRDTGLYRFSLTSDPPTETLIDALGIGVTAIERRWTRRQRQTIGAAIAGASVADIARQENITVHSVYKVRGAGGHDAYVAQWRAIDEALACHDREHGLP